MTVAPANITALARGQIFVFGSNTHGIHGAGAAKQAWQCFGAAFGVAEGMTGSCYAIPTRKYLPETKGFVTLPLARIGQSVELFLGYARSTPHLTYLVTPIGTGRAGYRPEQIAPLFRVGAGVPPNVHLPQEFLP